MNLLVVISVFSLLLVLLMLLNNWQRKIESRERETAVSRLRQAEERGSTRPVAQHPQIDAQACIGCGSCVAACPEEGVLGLIDGVAHLVNGSRCIGHGLCATACPVAAVTIGLGDISDRSDIPRLSPTYQSSVAGIYIAGELGGFALIRVAVEQGVRAVDAIEQELRDRRSATAAQHVPDLLIVGAGPAGFAAALRAIELGLTYCLIDQDDLGGTVRKYPRRKLTLTGRLELPLHGVVRRQEFLKEELIEFWESIAREHGVRIQSDVKLTGISAASAGSFVATTSAGDIAARRVILALGRRGTPRRLGVPGEGREKVVYQLVDAATYHGESILVVGGGDSAVEAATALASQGDNDVFLSYRRAEFFRLKARNEQRLEEFSQSGRLQVLCSSEVERIDARSVTLTCREGNEPESITIPNDYVFVCAGGEPPYPLLERIGVQFNRPADAQTVSDSEALETVA